MNKTTYLELNKPEYSDYAQIPTIYNETMDTIDTAIHNLQDKGAANAGKFLIVGSDGVVVPTTVPFANGGTY